MNNILSNEKGNLRLELKSDRLSAWLTILDKGILTDENDILELIDRAGIKTGFDEALKYMRQHGIEKDYGIPFPVAMCNHVKGESRLIHYFDTAQALDLETKISLGMLDKLTCVEAGAVIADYHSNIFERQGSIYDIYGNMIPDDELDTSASLRLAGRNVGFDETRQHFTANATGYISLAEDGTMSVIDSIVHEGDLDSISGVIRTPVKLTIHGSVRTTEIAAQADVAISGDLENSRLYCEGQLVVEGAIKSCRQPGIEVLGGIWTKGIVFSRVLCRGELEFATELYDCEVVAEAGIHSESGCVVGGHIQSCGNITIAGLGNQDRIPTELEITIGPYYKALLMRLTKQLIHLKQEPGDNSSEIDRINDRIKSCESELDQQLNSFLQRPPDSRLKLSVRGDVLPPVRIRILKHEYNLTNHQSNLELLEKD